MENRLTSAFNSNIGQTVNFQYGVTGQKLAAFLCTSDDGNGNPRCLPEGTNVYFGRKLIANPAGSIATDRLGSVRGVSAATQTQLSYYPYGQEHPQSNGQTTPDGTDKYATYFRYWIGQDYANQRYYNQVGAFFSADPAGMAAVNPSNPSSWNHYGYSLGDPINFYDPVGRASCDPDLDGSCDDDPEFGDALSACPADEEDGVDGDGYTSADIIGYDADGNPIMSSDGQPTAPYVTASDGFSLGESMPSPMVGPPDSFFILPRGLGPQIRIIGSDGNANYNIDCHANHPDIGNPHGHRMVNGKPGSPEPIPPGSNIPDSPVLPGEPGRPVVGPYSPFPGQQTPTIGPTSSGSSVIISINPCLVPIIRDQLPSCRSGPRM